MWASESVWEGLCVQGGVKGLGHSLRSQMPAASREGVQNKGDSSGQAWRHGPWVRWHSEDILVVMAERCAHTARFSLLT